MNSVNESMTNLDTRYDVYSENDIEIISPDELTGSIIFSSLMSSNIYEVRKTRKQWTTFQYLLWLIPFLITVGIYISQLSYGCYVITIPNHEILAVYNITCGILGLTLSGLRVWECWVYIKPIRWVTEDDLIDRSTCLQQVGWSFLLFLFDAILFFITMMGNTLSLILYGAEWTNSPFMIILTFINIIFQSSKYGLLVFTFKYLIGWKTVMLLGRAAMGIRRV
jgi:hypothetical protein